MRRLFGAIGQVNGCASSVGRAQCSAPQFRPIPARHARHLRCCQWRRNGPGTHPWSGVEWNRNVVVLDGPHGGLRHRCSHMPMGEQRRVLRRPVDHVVVRAPPLVSPNARYGTSTRIWWRGGIHHTNGEAIAYTERITPTEFSIMRLSLSLAALALFLTATSTWAGDPPTTDAITPTPTGTNPADSDRHHDRQDVRTDNQDIRGDRHELAHDQEDRRQDVADVRKDQQDIRSDQHDIRQDKANHNQAELAKDQHELGTDRTDRAQDSAHVKDDNKDIHADRHDLHVDRQDRRGDRKDVAHDRLEHTGGAAGGHGHH